MLLPKFKVAVDFTGKDNHAKQGYRPGDHVTGTVRANYFFGKPVEEGEVTVKASSMDVSIFDVGSVQGKTDHEGAYHFDLKLPDYFAGKPLSQGAARVLIGATVKDSASHSETRGEPITVSESPLLITAVPEGGTLVPNLENQIFILASYPDGTPASAVLKFHGEGITEQSVSTDDGGVAIVRLTPRAGVESIEIEASDKDGNHATNQVQLQSRLGEDQILLRTERAVYRAGDRISLSVFSTKARGTAYLDIVKEGQTVLTRDIEIEGGRAELSLTATPELAGTVDFNAYLFGRDARPIGDHRLVFVQPAEELKIETTTDSSSYKPGGEARIRFRVTNSRGEGVHAALGLQVVDEAVFALAEKQPGFAKVFFYLEQEAMKPRYEIHSIGAPELVEPMEESKLEQRDRAARALFSATEMVNTNNFETEFGRTVPMTKYPEYAVRYQKRFRAQVNRLAETLSRAYRQDSERGDLTKVFGRISTADRDEVRDAWDTELRVERIGWYRDKTHYIVRSAGADHRFDTGDDMVAYLEVRPGKIVGRPDSGSFSGSINLDIEHDHGPFNGLAEIAGTVTDPSGATVASAIVELRRVSTGKTRTARTNAAGQFSLSAIPAGDYEVQVSCAGFRPAELKFAVHARDRAVLSANVRSYFPEALYINPEIITDGNGNASIEIPIADSITTWRMAMLASTQSGALGSAPPASRSSRISSWTSTCPSRSRRAIASPFPSPSTTTPASRQGQPQASAGRTGTRWKTTRPRRLSPSNPAASAARSSRSTPTASANSSSRSPRAWGGEARARHRRPRNRSHPQRPRAEHRLQRPPRKPPSTKSTFPPTPSPTPPASSCALSRPAQPDHRRHGQHSAHARRLLRADLFQHLPQRAGARLHEAHQKAHAREFTPRPRATSPTATSACSPSKCPAAASPGSARRRPTRSSPPTA
jgi:hypothetical protein